MQQLKQYWIAVVIFAAITGGTFLGVSCAPKALSQGTIEIFDDYTGGCSVIANIDGSTSSGNAMTFGYGSGVILPFTFSNTIPPGDHTLNFSSMNSCSGSCTLTGPNYGATSSYPLTFYVGAGDIYAAYISQGTNCSDIQVGVYQ